MQAKKNALAIGGVRASPSCTFRMAARHPRQRTAQPSACRSTVALGYHSWLISLVEVVLNTIAQ